MYTVTAFTRNMDNEKVPCYEGNHDKKNARNWFDYFLRMEYVTEVAMWNHDTGEIEHIIK